MSDLRKECFRRISRNPETGNIDDLGGKNDYHRLSEEDNCLESYHVDEDSSCDCGCFAPPGGRCGEPGCGRISCVKCHRHCGGSENQVPEGCGKPICREHAFYLQSPDGSHTVPFCRRCHGQLVRKERWVTVGRILSLPFVEDQEERNG